MSLPPDLQEKVNAVFQVSTAKPGGSGRSVAIGGDTAPSVIGMSPEWKTAADWTPRRMEFTWDGRIALHSFNVLPVGEEGIGKGLLIAHLAAALSTGAMTGVPARVAIAPTEEDPAAAIIPRLIAAGADLGGILVRDQGSLNLPAGIPALEQWIADEGIAFLFLDTINGHFGEDKNFNYAQPVELTCNALAAVGPRRQLTVCGSLHTNRGGSVIARERYAHQLQFRRSARSAVLLGKVKEDEENQRTIVHDKHNYSAKASALTARIELVSVSMGAQTSDVPRLVIVGETDATSEDLFLADADRDAAITKAKEAGTKRDQCAEQISSKWREMGSPPELEAASFEFLKPAYSDQTIGRARGKLGIQSEQVKDQSGRAAGWLWRWPS